MRSLRTKSQGDNKNKKEKKNYLQRRHKLKISILEPISTLENFRFQW